jgi:cob(I)alamin adenosyltransferase
MSIATKTGDQGTTGLMYNRRVSKCDARVEACGSIDELNAALGLARCNFAAGDTNERLLAIQKDLVAMMGELATDTADLERYHRDGYPRIERGHTERLEHWLAALESAKITFQGWAMPGANPASAALDYARTVCRRAERRVCALLETAAHQNPETMVYLNRLSDLLWLLARSMETRPV